MLVAKFLLEIFRNIMNYLEILCVRKRGKILSNLPWVTVWTSTKSIANYHIVLVHSACAGLPEARPSSSNHRFVTIKAVTLTSTCQQSTQLAQCSSTPQHLQANKKSTASTRKVSNKYTGSALLSFIYICILCLYSYFSLT